MTDQSTTTTAPTATPCPEPRPSAFTLGMLLRNILRRGDLSKLRPKLEGAESAWALLRSTRLVIQTNEDQPERYAFFRLAPGFAQTVDKRCVGWAADAAPTLLGKLALSTLEDIGAFD